MKFLNLLKKIKDTDVYHDTKTVHDTINSIKQDLDDVDTKYTPEAIYCNLSADVQMKNNYYNISNWSQVKKVGDGFSISSGKIYIGAGINTIKITVKVGVGVNSNSLFYSYIIKNSGNLTESREIHYIRTSEPQIVYNQAVTSVSEGDVITISHYGDGTIMRESTSIIVEKID